jgi:cell division protein FtsQ
MTASLLAPSTELRLLQGATSVVGLLAVGALLAGALAGLARSPWLPLRAIVLDGVIERSSVATLRAYALPRLSGNLLGLDLQQARAAFESAPWVRRATVRRQWPDRLLVTIEEHEPTALWRPWPSDADGQERLVNAQGEIFEANVGDVDDEDALPLFEGPAAAVPAMRAMHERLKPLFDAADLPIERLALSLRGSWQLSLVEGGVVELGRGSEDEIAERARRFTETIGEVSSHFKTELAHADLRHPDAYAVRLRHVTTQQPEAPPVRRR